MMISLFLLTLSASPAVALFSGTELASLERVDLSFAPEAGTQLQKSFSSTLNMESEELTCTSNGQPIPAQYLPQLEILVESEVEVTVLDRYGKVEEGRPASFEREFETLEGRGSSEVTVPPEPQEVDEYENEHDLTGETVAFEWNAETEEYDRRVVSSEEEFDGLEQLSPDLDLLAFLPEESVAKGDSWKLDVQAVYELSSPGGDLGLSTPEEEGEPFEDVSIEGEMSATLVRVEVVDGMKQAVIELEGDYVHKTQRPTVLDDIPITSGTAMEIVTTRYDVDGTIVWNLSSGHAHSIEVQSNFEMESDTIRDEGQEGPGFTSKVTFSGEQEVTAQFTLEVE